MEQVELIAKKSFVGFVPFSSFEEAARGFVLAAGNGSGYYPGRLKELLVEKPARTAKQLCWRIDKVQALPKPGLKKKRSPRRYPRFSVEVVRPGVYNFFWVCGPRPLLEGEEPSSSRTIVVLNSATMIVTVKSPRRISVDHRIKAAKGEWSPFAHKRATGKV